MRLLRWFALIVFITVPAVSAPPEMVLEVPELNMSLEANGATVIPRSDITHFEVRIAKQPSQVNYGSIFGRINTESANIVMTTVGTESGILCKFDLTRQAGFLLKPGRNSIELSFSDPRGRIHYASFLLQTSQRPTLPPASRENPEMLLAQKYAVVVGISKYQYAGSGLQNLRYADRDATSIRDFLTSQAGGELQPENIKFLVNEEATSKNVRSALFTFLTRARPEDMVVIYFAAHGAPDPHDRRNTYLLTYDSNPEDMGGTAIPMFELQDLFARSIRAKRVVTLADSCHSYGISGEQYGGSTKANNLVNQYLTYIAGEADRAVMTGSDVSELSAEGPQWGGGHGVFTYFLLQGLKGAADHNKDGTVTAGELFRYVRDKVQDATDGSQTPLALPGLADRLPLSGVAVGGRPHIAKVSRTTAAGIR